MFRLFRDLSLPYNVVQVRKMCVSAAGRPLVLQIWGSNTGVGKTVLSAGLLLSTKDPTLYLKPVQTGYPTSDDSAQINRYAPKVHTLTLHAYEHAVSPDLASSLERSQTVTDVALCSQTEQTISHFYASTEHKHTSRSLALIETAGGVLSPGPSGSLQADIYRPLRLPALLLGDANLGGISATLSAYEAMCLRGYSVPGIVMFAEGTGLLENESSIQKCVKPETVVFRAPELPPPDISLDDYFRDTQVKHFFKKLHDHLRYTEGERFNALSQMKEESQRIFWYPFTQHSQLGDITCIDSAHGEQFIIHKDGHKLQPMTDVIGSWWTNGVGHGDSETAKAIGSAAGRYGHVMFAEATFEPAFELAKRVLDGPGAGWASRAFYSDDGSTAVEVALKMAFRKRAMDSPARRHLPVRIVGLAGSYHGDTLGVMNCAADSDYNRLQTPWYQPLGFFFEPPCAAIRDGIWTVEMPDWLGAEHEIVLDGRDELFSMERSHKEYEDRISRSLDEILGKDEVDIGALVMEPVFLGGGGMKIVDPAFQRALVDACRKRGIPVIFDEIFTGLWRLGVESGSQLLGREPDIAAYGKLLTGGTVPLAITISTHNVFQAFAGCSKKEALLHGHSYTAHAIGCAAGVESLKRYDALKQAQGIDPNIQYWNEDTAREISTYNSVKSVTTIGTVLSVELGGKGGSGYAATGAYDVAQELKDEGIFARPLGNVIYMMCTPISHKAHCDMLLARLTKALQREGVKNVNTSDRS
ncbi:Bifunctional dethiobiotin synthetase/7,8-diamino-pelargonic acid aminotransferase, mitochondrial [Gracilariopsis chorda]|uniref:Bifunctional dethiobiotin synthetase/7,8-diamino-pelargonic acid aminotransferase, mitochondrial n=1 Tax=Gracilariopsis chorda TaxID=448386 RepID=A0A2V3J4R3_9FLOR|nr:Bifunctional dethiobiotin synthetase/7,8-diamino-pelargonic acid aminotransferase, mitochondrial [Gracilariopsis chorda]|eukprot:PXF49418.1 Bifunctional dethiobiotin synthetase/7,8-diamino-pelargonic acid aminotransferase, mitochondrial [Gracilariopsis chorda]